MIIDKQEFIADYIIEAREYLDSLDDIAIQLTKDSRNEDLLKDLLRILHTLKGSSRMMEFFQIEKIVHSLETVFKNIQNNQTEVSTRIVQLLMNVCQVIRKNIDAIEKGSPQEIKGFDFIIRNINNAAEGEDFTTDIKTEETQEENKTAESESELFHDSQTIKIQISQINSILQEFDKLIMKQIKLKTQIAQLEGQKGDEGHIISELNENMEVLESQSFEIQEKIISLRMLPFDMILQPIKRNVVSEAMKLGKNIEFDIPHSEITIDKAILENLPKILMHIVRNSMDHGIENPDERTAHGKDEKGHVSVTVNQVSNRIFVTISDDGRGLDYEKIRFKALKLFPEREKEILQMPENDLQQFLFVSGFSTRDKVTDLSGRGIGMDVVRTEMDKLKGKIVITSTKGKGTSTELSLPSSLATQDGLFIRAGNNKYLILSHYIKEIITADRSNFLQMQHGPVLTLHNELIPIYDFDSITGQIETANRITKNDVPVVVLEYLHKKIGVITDEILHYSTVVIKPLPPLFKDSEALQGIVFDENYHIIPVLNIPDSMKRFKAINVYDVKNLEVKKKRRICSVLVVDDSHTTRHIEQIILEAEGYKVTTACDGIDALEKLKQHHFDLVISDIRMPRMDGFVLVHNIKHTEELKHIPVIVISSVFEEDTNAKLSGLGADAYIVKSDFERENLIAKAKELLHDN